MTLNVSNKTLLRGTSNLIEFHNIKRKLVEFDQFKT